MSFTLSDPSTFAPHYHESSMFYGGQMRNPLRGPSGEHSQVLPSTSHWPVSMPTQASADQSQSANPLFSGAVASLAESRLPVRPTSGKVADLESGRITRPRESPHRSGRKPLKSCLKVRNDQTRQNRDGSSTAAAGKTQIRFKDSLAYCVISGDFRPEPTRGREEWRRARIAERKYLHHNDPRPAVERVMDKLAEMMSNMEIWDEDDACTRIIDDNEEDLIDQKLKEAQTRKQAFNNAGQKSKATRIAMKSTSVVQEKAAFMARYLAYAEQLC